MNVFRVFCLVEVKLISNCSETFDQYRALH